jgi:TolB-like protein
VEISRRPAVTVLPFDDFSLEPDQGYLADGIVEDLVTLLSRWRWFPVIAHNSSFAYRGRAVDVKQVSRELGARYLVEGSVRRAGRRLRVNAQLIDATAGEHIWAQIYDRELVDLFDLQDASTILPNEINRYGSDFLRKDTTTFSCWCLSLQPLSSWLLG